jgi:hypothetical protein
MMMTKKDLRNRFSIGALALAAAALLALAPDASADPGGFSPGGAGTSGTLPLSAPSGGPSGLPTNFLPPYPSMLRKAAKPATTLAGTVAELNELIVASYSPDGSGWFSMTPVAPNGTLTISFYGNVVLDLDRAKLLAGQAVASLSVDPTFNGGLLSVKPSGMRRTTQVLRTGLQNLQLERMTRSGLVEEGVQVKAVTNDRSRKAGFEIVGQGGVIRIEQSH